MVMAAVAGLRWATAGLTLAAIATARNDGTLERRRIADIGLEVEVGSDRRSGAAAAAK